MRLKKIILEWGGKEVREERYLSGLFELFDLVGVSSMKSIIIIQPLSKMGVPMPRMVLRISIS